MKKPQNLVPILILTYAAGYALNILLNSYLTHHMGPAMYGDYCIGLNILEMAATLILLGTEISAVRFIPLFDGLERTAAFIRWNLRFIAKSFAYFLVFVGLAIIVNYVWNDPSEELHFAIYMLFAAPFSALYALLLSYLNARNNILLSTVVDAVVRYVVIWGAFIVLLSALNVKADSLLIGTLYMAVFFLLSAFVLAAYNKLHAPIGFSIFTSDTLPENGEKNQWITTSLHYVFANMVFLVFLYVDKMILEIVHSNERVVGHYSLLIVLVGLFTLASRSSAAVLSPHISIVCVNKESNRSFQKLIDKTNTSSFVFFAALFAAYFFFGETILQHFGNAHEYSGVYSALIYLSLSQIFLEIGKSALRFLLYGGFSGYINKVFVLCIALLIGIGVPMTYWFGLNGMVASHLITSFIYMGAFVTKAKKEFAGLKVLSFY